MASNFSTSLRKGEPNNQKERLTKLRKCREIVECLLKDQGPNGVRYAEIHHWLAKYGELYKDGWTLTFVGCCHDINFPCECKHSASSCSMSYSKSGCNLHTDMQRHQPTSPRYGHEDSLDDGAASTTRFNVPALVPSVQRAYVDLWDTIELSFLGYYDAERERQELGIFTQCHPSCVLFGHRCYPNWQNICTLWLVLSP